MFLALLLDPLFFKDTLVFQDLNLKKHLLNPQATFLIIRTPLKLQSLITYSRLIIPLHPLA